MLVICAYIDLNLHHSTSNSYCGRSISTPRVPRRRHRESGATSFILPPRLIYRPSLRPLLFSHRLTCPPRKCSIRSCHLRSISMPFSARGKATCRCSRTATVAQILPKGRRHPCGQLRNRTVLTQATFRLLSLLRKPQRTRYLAGSLRCHPKFRLNVVA